MVDGDSGARVCSAVPGVCAGGRDAAGRVGVAVRGFCGVAKGASGAEAGTGTGVLAWAVGRLECAGVADGLSTAGGGFGTWTAKPSGVWGRVGEAGGGVQPAAGSYEVHDAAGGLSDVVGEVLQPAGHSGGDGDRESQSAGDGRVDRIFHQHVGVAEPGGGEEEICGVCGGGERDGAVWVCASGSAV